MVTNDPNQLSLIDETVNAFDSSIRDVEPRDGLTFIDRWLDRLDEVGDEATDEIADTLEELRAELDPMQRDSDPNTQAIAEILQDLINQTQKVMQTPEASAEQEDLSRLVATLENIHRQLANA